MRKLDEAAQVASALAEWAIKAASPALQGTSYAALATLPSTASADAVAAIVGNHSLVDMPICDECLTPSWQCVEIGYNDEDSRVACLCAVCLRAALDLLEPPHASDV